MAISNSFGKNCSSDPKPWQALESGSTSWEDFSHAEQGQLVQHYGPKIRYLALRLKAKTPKHIEINDLLSAGSLGLMEALGKFKPSLGIKFDTYAENRIRGAMLDELRRLDWFPRSLRKRVRQLDEANWKIEQEKGLAPSEEELAEITGLDIKEVRLGLEALQNQLSISIDIIQDSLIQDSGNIEGEPYQNTAFQDTLERIAGLIETLTDREKLVLSLYYSEELNMRETAEVMGVTEGRVSQLHTQALMRLRREFNAQYGDGSE